MADIVFANPHQPSVDPSSSSSSTLPPSSDATTLQFGGNDANGTTMQTYWFLQQFDEGYAPIHAYLSAVISVMGVFANLLTIVIMSRPDMRTPTNRLYAVMAFADLVTMFLYSIFAIFFQIAFPDSNKNNLTELRAIFMVIYADLSVFAHTVSVAILVAVTVFRVLILQLPAPSSKKHCSLTRANWAAVIAFACGFLVVLPNVYITSWRPQTTDNSGPVVVEYWEVYQREDDFSAVTSVVNFWFQAIFVKLLPCLLLTLASIAIVRTLQEAEARRRRLQGDHKPPANNTNNKPRTSDPRIRNRTLMLLGLLVVFLLTEFPQGILTLVCGIMGDAVWSSIYMPLGNFLDMLTLINAGVNFILFASMSSEFRLALNRQLSTWCHCYAEMLAKKEQERQAKRFGNGHLIATADNNKSNNNNNGNNTEAALVPSPKSKVDASSSAAEQQQLLMTQSGVSVSLKSYLGDSANIRDSNAISTLILTDLDNLVDGELVIKKPKSVITPETGHGGSKRSRRSSLTSSASSVSKKDSLANKTASKPLVSKEDQV